MSRERLADAFDKAAEAFGQLAHELRGADEPGRVPSVPAPTPAAGAVPSPAPAAADRPDGEGSRLAARRKIDESAFTECPAHRQPFKEGRYGLYCSGQSDDPDWSNDKGYCRVTPRSAGAWLRQHPNGAPAPAPQDVDDIPF